MQNKLIFFLKKIPEGKIFTYDDIGISNRNAAAIYLSRLFKANKIKKISKGKFYKSIKSRFGKLPPDSNEIINTFIKKYNGYITGAFLYNIVGLSTQFPSIIEIATNRSYSKIQINNLKIKFVPSKIKITEKNKRYLQLLDIIKNLKKAPDVYIDKAIQFIIKEISKMNSIEINELVKLSMNYNPMVRAILGAIFEYLKMNLFIQALKSSLNKTTSYKIGISDEILPTKKNWKII